MADDKELAVGEARSTAPPHAVDWLEIPAAKVAGLAADLSSYVHVIFQRADGSEIARRSVEVLRPAIPAVPQADARVGVRTSKTVSIIAGATTYEFDPQTCRLIRAVSRGKQIAEDMRLTLWHPLDQFDILAYKREGKDAATLPDLDRYTTVVREWKVTPDRHGVTIGAKTEHTVDAQNRFAAAYRYTVREDGGLEVEYTVTPRIQAEWVPEVGMELHAAGEGGSLRWLGLGPMESGPNMKMATIFGLWTLPMDSEDARGLRSAVRWAEIGSSLRVEDCGYLRLAGGGRIRILSAVHSVGVTRQYCGEVGKQENCRIAVSLSVATWDASLPIAYRLYLPKDWVQDPTRREKAEVPEEVEFQTKPEIALEQIRAAAAAQVARGVVLADAAYGINTEFREGVTQLELQYVVGVQSSLTVWEPGKQPLPAKPRGKTGRPPRLLQRTTDHQPVSVKQVAMSLPSSAFQDISWREGTEPKLRSRFAVARVRPAHRDYEKAEPHAEEWLLIEWPRREPEPTKYWLSTLPPNTPLKALAKMAKHRWIIAAYGFLVAERNRFSPSARAGDLGFVTPGPGPDFRPRGSPRSPRTA